MLCWVWACNPCQMCILDIVSFAFYWFSFLSPGIYLEMGSSQILCVLCLGRKGFSDAASNGNDGKGLKISLLPPCNGVDLVSKGNGNSHPFKKMTMTFFNQKLSLWFPMAHMGPTNLKTCNLSASHQQYMQESSLWVLCINDQWEEVFSLHQPNKSFSDPSLTHIWNFFLLLLLPEIPLSYQKWKGSRL